MRVVLEYSDADLAAVSRWLVILRGVGDDASAKQYIRNKLEVYLDKMLTSILVDLRVQDKVISTGKRR